MKRKGKFIAEVAALLLGAALGAAAQAPAAPAAKPIVLEVTWTLDLQDDYRSSAKIVLEGKYQVEPRGQYPWPCSGWEPERIRDGEKFCFWLKYQGGRLVQGEGVGQGEKVTFLDDPGQPSEGHIQGANQIAGDGQGGVTLHLDAVPGFTWPESQEGARELALGCWSEYWPVPKITYDELRNLSRLRHAPWSSPIAGPELPNCHGTLTVQIRASGGPECEPLKTACERAKSWFECAKLNVSNLLTQIAQAKADVATERTTRQAQFPSGEDPEAAGYQQLEMAVDRLMQQVSAWQANLLTARVNIQADCALLPGPEDEKECQETASRAEEATKKSREELKRELERELMIFESSTAGAPSSLARARLLAQLRATLAQLAVCQ